MHSSLSPFELPRLPARPAAPRPAISRRGHKRVCIIAGRLLELLHALDEVNRHVPLPPALAGLGRRLLNDFARVSVGTDLPFAGLDLLPKGKTLMPADLFVAALQAFDAATRYAKRLERQHHLGKIATYARASGEA